MFRNFILFLLYLIRSLYQQTNIRSQYAKYPCLETPTYDDLTILTFSYVSNPYHGS